tara:strand:- start:4011 stop:5834 length:1824 start_codon:yes stop_codon:yes gene_type:complete
MPNAANVSFNIINNAQIASQPLDGVFYVEGITERGPFGDPKEVITSWSQFVSIFGGLIDNSDFPLLCKRALDAGALLRVNRIGHYTDISNKSTLDAVIASTVTPSTITFDADFVTGNTIDLTINSTAITQITFATDQATTLAALATEIGNSTHVSSVQTVGADRRLIVYPKANAALTIAGITVAGGSSQANGTAATASASMIDTSLNSIFSIAPKYKGVAYNDLSVTISDASNGQAGYFKIDISLDSILETHDNITITGQPTAGNSTYLDDIVNNSIVASVTYQDLSSLTGQVRPANGKYVYASGSDGTSPVSADYVGSSAGKTGFYAFDEYDEGFYLAAPEISASAVNIGGSSYAAGRKDLIFFAHLGNNLTTSASLITDRSSTAIDSQYTAFYGGGIKVLHPTTQKEVTISEMGDILGLAAIVHTNLGQWRSFAGPNNGKVTGATGVANNFGSNGLFDDLNKLANRQINMMILRDNVIQLSGNFTGVLSESPESFNSVVSLLIYLKKLLKPVLNTFLEEPADIPTFKNIFYTVKPLLDNLVTERALFEYKWDGDQDAGTLAGLQVNTAAEVQQGRYKVNFYIKPINSLQEIKINIILTNAGVSFD